MCCGLSDAAENPSVSCYFSAGSSSLTEEPHTQFPSYVAVPHSSAFRGILLTATGEVAERLLISRAVRSSVSVSGRGNQEYRSVGDASLSHSYQHYQLANSDANLEFRTC